MSLKDLNRFLQDSQNLLETGKTNAEAVVPNPSLVPAPLLVRSVPFVGNVKSERWDIPYNPSGPSITIDYIELIPVILPEDEPEKFYKFPISTVTNGIYHKSLTRYGSFPGSAYWVNVDLGGLYQVGSVEISFGSETSVIAVEADGYSKYLSYRCTSGCVSLPKVTTSWVKLLVVVPSCTLELGGYHLFIHTVRVREWSPLPPEDVNLNLQAPHPIISIDQKNVKWHDTAEYLTLGSGIGFTNPSGLPALFIGGTVPGTYSRRLLAGDYVYKATGPHILRSDIHFTDNFQTHALDGLFSIENDSIAFPASDKDAIKPYRTPLADLAPTVFSGSSFSDIVDSFSLEKDSTMSYGNNDPVSRGRAEAIVMGSGFEDPTSGLVVLRPGYVYTLVFQDDGLGSYTVGLGSELTESPAKWEFDDVRFIDSISIDVTEIDPSSSAYEIYAITDDGTERLLTKSIGGRLNLEVGYEIQGFVLKVPPVRSGGTSIPVIGSFRKRLTVPYDCWARFSDFGPSTFISMTGARPYDTYDYTLFSRNTRAPILEVSNTREFRESLINDICNTRSVSLSSVTPEYQKVLGSVMKTQTVIFTALANGTATLTIDGIPDYADDSESSGTEDPQVPQVQLATRLSVLDDNDDPVTLTNGSSTFTGIMVNPRITKIGSIWKFNEGSFKNASEFPGTDTYLESNVFTFPVVENGIYKVVFLSPGIAQVSSVDVNVTFYDPIVLEDFQKPNPGFVRVGQASNYDSGVAYSDMPYVPGDGYIIPLGIGDELDIYSLNGGNITILSDRSPAYKIESFRVYEGTENSILLKEPTGILHKGVTTFDRSYLYFVSRGELGPRGLNSVFLGKPILSRDDASFIDFDNPTVASTPNLLLASYCRRNLGLYLFNARTLQYVADDEVSIRWSEGLIDLVNIDELIILWFTPEESGDIWYQISEEIVSTGTTVNTSSPILFRDGYTFLDKVNTNLNSTRLVSLADRTNYKAGPGNLNKTIGNLEFEIMGSNVIRVDKPGTYRVRYSTSDRQKVLVLRNLMSSEFDVNWHRLFSADELRRVSD